MAAGVGMVFAACFILGVNEMNCPLPYCSEEEEIRLSREILAGRWRGGRTLFSSLLWALISVVMALVILNTIV